MITWMEGGVIGGYCASGSQYSAIAPVRVMTMDSTEAKIGLSMKKCEIMVALPPARPKGRAYTPKPGEPGSPDALPCFSPVHRASGCRPVVYGRLDHCRRSLAACLVAFVS